LFTATTENTVGKGRIGASMAKGGGGGTKKGFPGQHWGYQIKERDYRIVSLPERGKGLWEESEKKGRNNPRKEEPFKQPHAGETKGVSGNGR